jgi:hypothetical protein
MLIHRSVRSGDWHEDFGALIARKSIQEVSV